MLDVIDPELPDGDHSGVAVRYATWRGPNVDDGRIRELVAKLDGRRLGVVTSDRALSADLRPSAQLVTAMRLLTSLDEVGC